MPFAPAGNRSKGVTPEGATLPMPDQYIQSPLVSPVSNECRCIDCGKTVCRIGIRCRSCMNRARWKDPNDPRRVKLRERNEAVRNGNTPYRDREWLRACYEDRHMSIREIAQEAHCAMRTIVRWMRTHGIESRESREVMRDFNPRGAASPAWKGGISPRPWAVRPWAEIVKERDEYTCQRCGTTVGVMYAHHIKSFDEYPDLRYEITNGITLCATCHALAHRGQRT